MSQQSGTPAREQDNVLDPARTGRNLHRRISESPAGALLDRLEVGGAQAVMHLCRALPAYSRSSLSELLRDAAFQLLSRQRRICYGNLTIARGSVWNPERIRSFTKRIFGYWCRAFVDFARLRMQMTEQNWDEFLVFNDRQKVDRVLDEHRGAILVGPHLGNWEFATQILVLSGYPLTSVARKRKKSSSLDRDLLRWRTKWGQRILYKEESPRKILRRLQSGELIGMVADQYAGRDGVFTDFFGAPTSHYPGPAVLADRADVPIIPGYCYRDEEEGVYRLVSMDPLFPDRDRPREERVQHLTGELFERIECMIRSHPTQWLWFHRKWRTKWLPDRYLELLNKAPYLPSD